MSQIDPQGKQESVWVAVLHYQDTEQTRACLKSIQKLDFPHFQTLIMDNCSPDQASFVLESEFPESHYFRQAENLGFAGGANAAVNYCIEHGARWIWLLNNDTELDKDSLSVLYRAAQKEPSAGILGASVYTPTANGLVRSGSGQIDFLRAKTFEKGIVDEQEETIACQWLSGCNMFFRASAFQELKGFDESFFLYFEDTDLCWRMNHANWTCLLVPGAKLKHQGNASTQGKLAIWRAYYYTRNRLLFFLKAKRGIAALPILFSIGAHMLRHSIVLPFRGENGKRQLKAELLGLNDYICGKFGKAECLDF